MDPLEPDDPDDNRDRFSYDSITIAVATGQTNLKMNTLVSAILDVGKHANIRTWLSKISLSEHDAKDLTALMPQSTEFTDPQALIQDALTNPDHENQLLSSLYNRLGALLINSHTGRRCFFVHIPKSAGSSVLNSLAQCLEPAIFVPFHGNHGEYFQSIFLNSLRSDNLLCDQVCDSKWNQIQLLVDSFNIHSDFDFPKIIIPVQHFRLDDVSGMLKAGDIVFSLLRNPREIIISDLDYIADMIWIHGPGGTEWANALGISPTEVEHLSKVQPEYLSDLICETLILPKRYYRSLLLNPEGGAYATHDLINAIRDTQCYLSDAMHYPQMLSLLLYSEILPFRVNSRKERKSLFLSSRINLDSIDKFTNQSDIEFYNIIARSGALSVWENPEYSKHLFWDKINQAQSQGNE